VDVDTPLTQDLGQGRERVVVVHQCIDQRPAKLFDQIPLAVLAWRQPGGWQGGKFPREGHQVQGAGFWLSF
jgi:hypothetical protein